MRLADVHGHLSRADAESCTTGACVGYVRPGRACCGTAACPAGGCPFDSLERATVDALDPEGCE